MGLLKEAIEKKGYIPLSGDERHGCISWQGQPLRDFWMWNGRFNEVEGGGRTLQTIQVTEVKEAAMHYWRDGWVPVKPATDELLRRMEAALRDHKGLKMEGVRLPDGPFLEPRPLPPDCG